MKGQQSRLEASKQVLGYIQVVYFILFMILIVNIVRFLIVESQDVIINPFNSRLKDIEGNIYRGTIYDESFNPLAQSVDIEGEMYRIYPYENKFAHIIGYTDNGKTGIEALYNIQLLQSNESPFEMFVNDFKNNKTKGNNIVTTLDKDLQLKAYELLGENKGAIVALEPSTGKIKCMVSKPDFNPNDIAKDWDMLNSDTENSPLYNRASQGLYPPGSTYKILTTIAYLNQYSDKPFRYNCTGKSYFGERVMTCYGEKAHGEVDLRSAFAQSCNLSFAKIGEMVDNNYLHKVSNDMLYNNTLPYPLAHSVSEFYLNQNSSDATTVETAIGQGETLVSPLHNALIVSSIANGGILMKPYVLDYIIDDDDVIDEKHLPEMYGQLMTPEISSTLTDYMTAVISEGTGKGAAIEGITVAGKTGTAENSKGAPHAWFVGFAPADHPQIAFAIVVENVGTSYEYAVPVARELVEFYFNK